MKAWLRQHWQALRRSLGKFAVQRMASILNALVIGIALALPAGGYTLLTNLQALTSRFSLEPQVSVFLAPATTTGEADALGLRLRQDKRLDSVRFVSRDEALKSLQRAQGFAEFVGALEDNPLPDAFVLRSRGADPASLAALAAELRRIPGVAHVQSDTAWAQRLGAITRATRLAILLLAMLLAAGLLAVTFNSIRLQILTQREEIEISKLLGATDGFIRRPFYYLGALQGGAGGLVALGCVAASIAVLQRGVLELAATYGSAFRLAFLDAGDAFAILLFSVLIGWLGANLSVSIYLRQIEQK